jgi:uncharacterized cupredoxin-like copper-binding protein
MHKLKIIFYLFVYSLFFQEARSQSSVTTININALSGMQFDLVRFSVKPNEQIRIVLSNNDDMTHNFLITKPGKRLDIVNAALKLEERGPALNYIPPSPDVLWSVPAIPANQTATLSFTSPSQPGAYPYVCTIPGHGFIMYGVMHVSKEGNIPDMATDPDIPPSRRLEKPVNTNSNSNSVHPNQDKSDSQPYHPYESLSPYLYRIFMEDAGPAAIAVSLPNDLSYCWDAGVCRLRYAWSGGFVDNTRIWKGHADVNAKITGTVFYRDNTAYPILIGQPDQLPAVEFRGYSLVNKYPEFHYTINGIDVFELILPRDDGKGLIRKFRIPEANDNVWFSSSAGAASIVYEVSAGNWINGKLKLSPEQAKDFSINMINYSLVYGNPKKKSP